MSQSQPESSQATQAEQPTPATQPRTQFSQPSEQKLLSLAGGDMRVVGHGKRRKTDAEMTLQLEFTFEHDPRVRKVGKYLVIVQTWPNINLTLTFGWGS